MPRSLPPLPWLRAFEAAARHGGFRIAAEELALTPAAVSHQIRSLEKRLGFALFTRLPRGVALTEMGAAYLPQIQRAFDDIAAATSGLFGPRGERVLTIKSPVSFATLCLAPRLAAFRRAHPNIDIRFCSAIWADEIETETFDLEVRFGDGRWAGYRADVLLNDPCLAIAHPGAAGASLRDLAYGERIHVMGSEDVWVRVLRSLGEAAPADPRGFRVDTSLAAMELAAAGAGCAMILKAFAAPYIAAGRLWAAPGFELAMPESHYLLTRSDPRGPSPDALLLRDWLLNDFTTGR